VREAYIRKGWSFTDPNGIEQCVEEGWVDKMQEQNTEGCRIDGRIRVNKVSPVLVYCWMRATLTI